MWWLYLSLLFGQLPPEPFTSPAVPAEYGHGLTAEEAKAGWIALVDSQVTYGWTESTVESTKLPEWQTTSLFTRGKLKGEVLVAGDLKYGDQILKVGPGKLEHTLQSGAPSRIGLRGGLRFKSLCLKPTGLKSMWNGRDLSGSTILRHPDLPPQKQARWSIDKGTLCAVGGPGAVEFDGRYGDFLLQVEVRMRQKLVNGGVFFRSVPAQFMNGYEAQLFNGCYQQDPGRPARYSTGAIDDRLLARRLVSRDLEPFVMTIIAVGPHIATWVNGYQTVDWTDTRTAHENPREGMRLEPGTIQLQAHDPETDIEFRRVEIAEIK